MSASNQRSFDNELPPEIIEDEDGNEVEDNQWERRKRKNKWRAERRIDDYVYEKNKMREDF